MGVPVDDGAFYARSVQPSLNLISVSCNDDLFSVSGSDDLFRAAGRLCEFESKYCDANAGVDVCGHRPRHRTRLPGLQPSDLRVFVVGSV